MNKACNIWGAAKFSEMFMPFLVVIMILNWHDRLLNRGRIELDYCATRSSCSYEAFESAHKKLIGAAWLGLPSQSKLQIPSQPKLFKTERDKHFSRLSLLVQALPCSTIRVSPS